MKRILYIFTIYCSLQQLIYAAADSDLVGSPTGTCWSDYLLGSIEAGKGWLEKQFGMKPISYCLDEQARSFLKEGEQRLELTLGDNRQKGITKSFHQLMQNESFQRLVKHLNDRAYFDWQHVRDAIKEERVDDVKKFLKTCSVNLSPCLRIPAELFLEQEASKRHAATRVKSGVRFDLQRTVSIGYSEAIDPEIKQKNASLATLNQAIRDYGPALSIASPLQRAERRMRKSMDPTFSNSYLTSAGEIEKAARVYAVYFAYLFRAYNVKNPIAELFAKPEFTALFNQVWDRNIHIRYVLQDQLTRASLDAGNVYEHHKINTPPLFAALVADMLLSHEQTAATEHIPQLFKDIFFTTKKPYQKYVCMFLKSLKNEQKKNIYALKDSIQALEPAARVALINKTIGTATEAQLHLLAEMDAGNCIEDIFHTLERALIRPTSPAVPASRLITIPTDITPSASPIHSPASSHSPSLGSSIGYPTLSPITPTRDSLLLTTPPLSSSSIDGLPELTASMIPTEQTIENGTITNS